MGVAVMTHSNGILLVFAFVLFFLAAVPYPFAPNPSSPWPSWRLSLLAAGLACWVGSLLF